MKRVAWITLTVLIALSVSSCGDDEGGGIDTNLFGTWTKVSTVLRDCGNPNDNNTRAEVCNDQVCEKLTITDDLRYQLTTLVRGQEQVENGQVQVGETQINFLPDNTTGNTLYGYTITATALTLSNETVVCTEDFVYNK